MESTEEWRPVVGHPGYEVSNRGRVRSVDRVVTRSTGARQSYKGKVLKQSANVRSGHMFVNIGRGNPRWVHQLVLEAFVGPRGDLPSCRHLDGDPSNNTLPNLKWGTQAENSADMLRHGTHYQVSKTHCKLGHAFDEKNTRLHVRADGGTQRVCRACHNEESRNARARQREAVANA